MDNTFFIIGGTEKAGTTSLFEYFGTHPQVTPSIRKETDFFRKNDVSVDLYMKEFHKPSKTSKLCMESSPGYLGLSDKVCTKMHSTLGDNLYICFVLRDPIERLKSSFTFHQSKYYIPKSMDLNEYVDVCLDFYSGKISLEDTPFQNPWFLNVLDAGKYKKHVQKYIEHFNDKTLLIDFELLKSSPSEVCSNICDFIQVDREHFVDFNFFKSNQTFQTKSKLIHQLGMKVNNTFEPILRKNPEIKRKIVAAYKKINGDGKPKPNSFNKNSIEKLRAFYSEDYLYCKDYFNQQSRHISWGFFND